MFTYMLEKGLQPCTFGIVFYYKENDLISLGFRHKFIVLAYTYVYIVD